MEDLDVDRG